MKKIDWTKWSSIAEILSAIAIVATLLYFAVQTQYLAEQTEQNNQFLRAQLVVAQAEYRFMFDERAIQNPDFADLVVRVLSGDELSQVDQLRVGRFIQSALSNLEMEYQLLEITNEVDREPFLENLRQLFESGYGLMRGEEVREAWERTASLRNQDFVRFVESNVLNDSD